MMNKDVYLENLYDTLEMCNLVLEHSLILPKEIVVKAERLWAETLKNIKLREAIPLEKRS